MNIDFLNKEFSIDSALVFRQLPSGIILLEINTPQAIASISLDGGQVVTWHPKNQVEPVLWLSKRAQFVRGKPIRGGVPICWPWFGAHPTSQKLPAHGYARITPWNVTSANMNDDGSLHVSLELEHNELSKLHWSHNVELMIEITVGELLIVKLTTLNKSLQNIRFTEGLHTYFNISDVSSILVKGFDGSEYIDLTKNNLPRTQIGSIALDGEIGRIFLNAPQDCVIEDERFKRRIRIKKEGSLSTAVWNPWAETAATIADLGTDGWRNMVCVEGANALENAITLEKMQSHTHTAIYSVENCSNFR